MRDDQRQPGLSRRSFLRGAAGLSGLVLTGCSLEELGDLTPPAARGGLIGIADRLTMATQRLLMAHQPLAQEHDPRDITRNFPTWGQTNPKNEDYQRLLAGDFADWRLEIGGLVQSPTSLSLDQLKGMRRRTQITSHICEQGWSAIAEWTGTPLTDVLAAAGGLRPEARYVVVRSFDGWYEGYDRFDVFHPQTILAYGMNGRDLPRGNGAPVRLRVERQCGYKQLKFVRSIEAVASMDAIGKGTGGINSDWGFHWYAGA
jgi:DMSO/TMAO reductase YedYZ molybdopterin-dependent catalytic subunit